MLPSECPHPSLLGAERTGRDHRLSERGLQVATRFGKCGCVPPSEEQQQHRALRVRVGNWWQHADS